MKKIEVSYSNFDIFDSRSRNHKRKIVQIVILLLLKKLFESDVGWGQYKYFDHWIGSYLLHVFRITTFEYTETRQEIILDSRVITITSYLHEYLVCSLNIGYKWLVCVDFHEFKDRRMELVDKDRTSSSLHLSR